MDLLEEFRRYYVINFLANNLTSSIPIRKIEDLGLRKTMSKEKVGRVFEILRDRPQDLPSFYKQRRSQVEPQIHSGDPLKVAQAVRNLTWRKENTRLSTSDSQLLAKGREMLIDEIALVTDSTTQDTIHQLEQALAAAIETRRAED